MNAVIAGFLAGASAGVVMGIISHTLYKLRMFRSSLIVIDGSFFFRTIGKKDSSGPAAAAGLVIHLVTSGAFGAIYFIATGILGINPADAACSFVLVGLYIAILWLSMLFIALPISGQGILGARSGKNSWLEQLLLHAVFFIAYTVIIRLTI